MKNFRIYNIINDMSEHLNINQLMQLQKVLIRRLEECDESNADVKLEDYVDLFIAAKQIEGCSERTLRFSKTTLSNFCRNVNMPLRKIKTDDIRAYLISYQKTKDCSKVTLDNYRRNLSSFFSWLEDEDYMLKNPVKRIHKLKTKKNVKETISDEHIEIMRDNCKTKRDLAMIDLLYSTGMRVGELVNIDIKDVDFEARECLVCGKGNKERIVYFDAKTKLHLKNYLSERTDTNQALFVSLIRPIRRLQISGVELRLRELGKNLGIERIYPHKFRRTMATRAINKGMPVEQLQKLLGHQQIDTTMQYAIVNQINVKNAHKKYIG